MRSTALRIVVAVGVLGATTVSGIGAAQAQGHAPKPPGGDNFINFCQTVPDLPLTNGQQIVGGSCNPAPIGAPLSGGH
jgi:hypothetical protein